MAKPRLSPAMERALRSAVNGLPVDTGIHGMSARGGLELTLVALRKRGYLDREYNITDAGRSAISDIKEPPHA